MHTENCKCAKCKKSAPRENKNPPAPSRIPTLQNKCVAFESATSISCDCSKEQKYGYVSYTKSEGKCVPANQGLENIKTLNIDVEETMKKQTRGCHCPKKLELQPKKITSSTTTGCLCAAKDVHISSDSIPVSLTIKNSSAQQKSACSCCTKSSDTLNVSKSKQIILPEVKIEICPDKIQTIQIDVKPTDLDTNTSGIIIIPVQLRFRKCQEEVVVVPRPVRTEKLLFESCTTKEYMENYMEALIEESDSEPVIQIEEDEEREIEIVKQETLPTTKIETCHCNDDGTKKTEIIGIKRAPWRDSMTKQTYIEPYLVEGYCASTDDVEVQTDLVLGELLLSDSLNSFAESSASRPDATISGVCICGKQNTKASATIRWDLLFLKPAPQKPITFTPINKLLADYGLIKKLFTEPAVPEGGPLMIPWTPPPPKGKKKKFRLSPCSPCCGGTEDIEWPEPPEPEPLPELVPLPEKIMFVYQTNCPANEPYLNAVARKFPEDECISTPPISTHTTFAPSKTVIPWQKLEIQKKLKIRKIMKFKIGEKKPRISASAPCTCISSTSVKETSSNKSVASNTPCPYLSKSVGNNQYKTKIFMDKSKTKSCPVTKDCEMKTKFLASGLEGKMSTKVTFKKDTLGPCKSNPKDWKISSTDISPISSKTVTCKYLNKRNMLESTENSRPELCAPDSCKFKKPQGQETCPCPPCQKAAEMFKTDPVVAAFQACELELKPVREALSTLKQNLKNLNMPELSCIFQNEEEDFNNMCQCNMQASQRWPSRQSGKSAASNKNGIQVRIRPTSMCPCKTNKSQSTPRDRPRTCNRTGSGSGFEDYNLSDQSSQMSTKNIYKAGTKRFYSNSTYNSFYPDPALPQSTPYNVNQTCSRQRGYNCNSTTNIYRASCNTATQNSSSSGSYAPPARRNKGIQKTGSMYRTNRKKRKCGPHTSTPKSSPSDTGTECSFSSASSASYIKPCSAVTQPKISKSPKCGKKIKSQLSFSRLSDSMVPFIEAIKSIMMVDRANKKDGSMTTKKMKKMRVHMRIRPSEAGTSQCSKKKK